MSDDEPTADEHESEEQYGGAEGDVDAVEQTAAVSDDETDDAEGANAEGSDGGDEASSEDVGETENAEE